LETEVVKYFIVLIFLLMPLRILPAACSLEWHWEACEWEWKMLLQAHWSKYGMTEATADWSYEMKLVIGPLGSSSSLSRLRW
jgi:hypothetical protein